VLGFALGTTEGTWLGDELLERGLRAAVGCEDKEGTAVGATLKVGREEGCEEGRTFEVGGPVLETEDGFRLGLFEVDKLVGAWLGGWLDVVAEGESDGLMDISGWLGLLEGSLDGWLDGLLLF